MPADRNAPAGRARGSGATEDDGAAARRPERIRWIGHSTVLLETGGARLLTDPLLRNRVGHLRRHVAPAVEDVAERIDAVLISHQHLDHMHAASLRRLSRDVAVLVPRGAGRLVRKLGFHRTTELGVGEQADVAGVAVTAVPAVHDGRRHPFGAPAEAIGFVVSGEQRVYFAGDTDVFDEMADLGGTLDAALLPIWGWGPSLGPGHMDPLGAARAAALLRPRVAVPIHWGTFFPMGLGRRRRAALVDPPRAFARHAAELAPGVEVRVLRPGESLALLPP